MGDRISAIVSCAEECSRGQYNCTPVSVMTYAICCSILKSVSHTPASSLLNRLNRVR